jgi:RimJ/RimL family protein N-acetyltransferase
MSKEMKAPERIETNRLVLRKPTLADADAVFARYASDPDVTKFMGWRRHQSVEETRAFLAFSDAEWERWPAGPYLIEAADGQLLGAAGLRVPDANDCSDRVRAGARCLGLRIRNRGLERRGDRCHGCGRSSAVGNIS